MSDFKTTDYKHLEGDIFEARVTALNGTVNIVLLEAALVEYDMGITLKSVEVGPDVQNTSFGTTCINGANSPNKRAYEQHKKYYDATFVHLIDCMMHNKIIELPLPTMRYTATGFGKVLCATGMPT